MNSVGNTPQIRMTAAKNKTAKKLEEVSFHTSIRLPLVIAQIFGFFPIQGVTNLDAAKLKFSWISLRTLYSLFTMLLSLFVIVLNICALISKQDALTNLVFASCSFISSLLFVRLARAWPEIVKNWSKLEVEMDNLELKTSLKKKMKLLTIVFLTIAAVEHVLSTLKGLFDAIKSSSSVSKGFRDFFFEVGPEHALGFVDYYTWSGLIQKISNIQGTFSWTFVDVFVILMSTALTYRMKQVVAKVEGLVKTRVKSAIGWRSVREEYGRMCRLCSLVDRRISFLVLLSYFTNLYFTLFQLFGTLKKGRDDVENSYFYVSFGFLIIRVVSVCLFGAAIQEENRKVLPMLLSVSSDVYNIEIKRFTDQTVFATVTLSGDNFFRVTRNLILKIAGAIVTYELVLIQLKST